MESKGNALQKVEPMQKGMRGLEARPTTMQPMQPIQMVDPNPMQQTNPMPHQPMRGVDMQPMQKVEPLMHQPLMHQPLMQHQHLQQPMMHQPMTAMEPHPTHTMQMQPVHKKEPSVHHQLIRGDRQFFSSDDSGVMKQVQGTHAPDGREVDVKPLLHIVEDILNRATPAAGLGIENGNAQALLDALEERTHQASFIGMLEALAYTIYKISCEISCKCLSGGDAHSTTLSLFHMLSSYSWDAKVVLALAAFAVNYGEFWLLVQLYPTNHLAKSIALLKQLPDALEHSEHHLLKPRFDALTNLVKAILDVTKCIVELTELPPQYITPDVPAMSLATAHVPTAAYWTIRSVVACASQITALIGLGHEYISSTSEAWELSSLAHKERNIHEHLKKQLAVCYQYIEERRHLEAYNTLVRLFEAIHIDNLKILKALFYSKDDLPLVDGVTKRRVTIDGLRRKSVLLLISDLTISQEEVSILEQLYRESRSVPARPESHYEVVWIPVVDRSAPWTEPMQKQFETMQMHMPWYTVHEPMAMDPAVIRYIKENWNFVKKPILVVLDPQGRVVSKNAIHMMWIWGVVAFPFTSAREEALWREETWRLELLVDGIDATLLNWIAEGRFICLYGGEDIAWIRKFTSAVRAVAREANISLEMVYVGKSNPRERVRRNNEIIASEKLSHYWPDLTSIWFFWVRLESMMYSKMQLGKTIANDSIMHEIIRMLGYDSGNQGWALISRGATTIPELSRANGEMMLTSFTQYETWKPDVDKKGFIPALNDHLLHIQTPHHCTHLKLPGTIGTIMETVVCAECGRAMEKYYLYECCDQ